MKKLFKNFIIITMILMCILAGNFVLDGYTKYKEIVKSTNIEEKINEIKHSKNYVNIENIDKDFINAIVSVEDHRFYNHKGIDFIAITRATLNNIKECRFAQGGSTITQQLAKNMFLNGDKNLSRKVCEAFLANKLEKEYSKNEILELYVNIINYGNGYTGIEQASEGYLNKKVNDLSVDESAMLAGLPQCPNGYNPNKYYNKAVARKQVVLQAINKYGEKDYESNDYILARSYNFDLLVANIYNKNRKLEEL